MPKWIYTEAVAAHGCPKCLSRKGSHCRYPSGRKKWPPHSQRISALTKSDKFVSKDYQLITHEYYLDRLKNKSF